MFKNPIKGSVGTAIKKVAGILYWLGCIALGAWCGYVLFGAGKLIFGGASAAFLGSALLAMLGSLALAAVIYLSLYVSVLMLTAIGEGLNALVVIANRMPKQDSGAESNSHD